MKQIVEKIKDCRWLRHAATGCSKVSPHMKEIGLCSVCLGAITALAFVWTRAYDSGYNILVVIPPILIIGGAATIVKGIKKDSSY